MGLGLDADIPVPLAAEPGLRRRRRRLMQLPGLQQHPGDAIEGVTLPASQHGLSLTAGTENASAADAVGVVELGKGGSDPSGPGQGIDVREALGQQAASRHLDVDGRMFSRLLDVTGAGEDRYRMRSFRARTGQNRR